MFKNDRLKVSRLLVSVLLIVMLIPSLVWAKEALPVAEDLEVEKRMLAITMDLRCLVCQNESARESAIDYF